MRLTRAIALGVVAAAAVGVFVYSYRARALPFGGRPAPTARQKSDSKQVALAVNGFAFRLAKEVAKTRKGGNMLISPFSVSTAHSMMLAGTVGDAKTELSGVLGYAGLDDEAIHGGMFALNYEAQREEGLQFRAANAFMQLDARSVKDAFRNTLEDRYDAEFRTLPGATPQSLQEINDWVRARTGGMIPVGLDQFPDQAVFVLLNASAFVAKWKNEFDPSNTQEASFKTGANRDVTVSMMQRRDTDIRIVCSEEGSEAVAAELPYKGDAFAMIALLPPSGQNVWEFLNGLNESRWANVIDNLRSTNLAIALPRFAFDDSYDLVPLLQGMGVQSLFSGGSLVGVSDEMPEAMVAVDVHKTHIEVDEKGTRAAAVTESVATGEASPTAFVADRAFVYAIVHKPTGVIVFLGVCSDPSKTR